MKITKVSPLTGQEVTREINISCSELQIWKMDVLPLSMVAPHVTDAEREFLVSGLTAEDWDEIAMSQARSDDDWFNSRNEFPEQEPPSPYITS